MISGQVETKRKVTRGETVLIPTLLNKINKDNSHEIGLAEAHYQIGRAHV